jgi:uncharacterized protein (TIGR03382 family)
VRLGSATVAGGLLLFCAAQARAQVEFQDDFESGPFADAGPGGVWSSHQTASVSWSLTALAAHRGNAGLRIQDNDSSSGAGQWAWLEYDFPGGAGILSSYYLRAWVRFTGTQLGDSSVIRLASPGPPYCEVVNALILPRYFAKALDAVGTNYSVGASVTGSEGPWQLIELGLTGMNTADAGFGLWIDGGYAARYPGHLDFTATQVGRVLFGEPYASDSSFTGTIDLDDVRTTTSPPASTLGVSGPATVSVGACNAFGLQLSASNGSPAPAPYDFPASIAVFDQSGVMQLDGGIFRDNICSAPSSVVNVFQAQSQATFWARFDQVSTVIMSPSYVDFVNTRATVSVVGGGADAGGRDAGAPPPDGGLLDGGPPGGSDGGAADAALPDSGAASFPEGLSANLGCDCSGAGAEILAATLLLLLHACVPRRRRATARLAHLR